jgi:hypothetical protein
MPSEWSNKIKAWLLERQPQLDLARPYWDALVEQWNKHLFETTSPIVVLFLIWWFIGAPPVTLVVFVVVWMFLLAGYYAWREERLKNLSDNFRCWIYTMTCGREENDSPLLLFVGLRLSNIGPPTSIHTWQGGYRVAGKGVAFTEYYFRRGFVKRLPDEIHGNNLNGDMNLFAQGETREGWVAIVVEGSTFASDAVIQIMQTIHLEFMDSSGHLHAVSRLADLMMRKSQ